MAQRHDFSRDHTEDGASAVEYGLLLAGIAALIISMVFLFGEAVADQFDSTCDSVTADSLGDMSCRNP
jgi:pilus assembly protein Flp/PilA